jgi:hypothetical protein
MHGCDQTLLADSRHYVAHPHMAVLPGGEWLLVGNRAPRRAVTLHPPQDPEFCNILLRSSDEGASWSEPMPASGVTGMECAGLTVLADGAVLLNQWRFRWYPSAALPDAAHEPDLVLPEALRRGLLASTELDNAALADEPVLPWARGGGVATVCRSDDGGRHFGPATTLDVAPYSGGYGMRGGVVLPDGEILLPLSDVPHYARIFLLRSRDGGRTWSAPEPVAAAADCEYEEPAPLLLADGAILMLLRENRSHTLHAVRSADAGHSWAAPEPTGITGYPAHLLRLPDGRLAAVTGRRVPPFGIVVFLSNDGGATWDVDHPITVRELPNRDLGYPTAALDTAGELFVAWYHRDAAGVTGLHATRLAL